MAEQINCTVVPNVKKWYESKTLWVNALAIVVVLGFNLSEAEIAAILGVINLILRIKTGKKIEW